MNRHMLLRAINTSDEDAVPPHWTSAAIAERLGVAETDADAALREAGRDGFVVEERDESRFVGPDFNRQVWHLSDAGRVELYRLEDERRAQ
jgi:DNA-binding MarR family transcriptional regulator